jgi:hypothetical protein
MTDIESRTPQVVERIGLVCEWFGLEMPPLEYEEGELLWTEALHAWVMREEVSIDWVVRGDSRVHAAVYRDEMRFRRLLRRMPEPMKENLADCLRLTQEGDLSFDEALAEFKRRCGARA